jgi:hypothetical protein
MRAAFLMTQSELKPAIVAREWNGTPITRRTTDGYVNATAMCKANGKQWNDYWRTDRATAYLEALCTETGIPVSSLCLSLKGGSHQGTWVHPQIAVDLARWISAPFAVFMDSWFLEELDKKRVSQMRDTRRPLPLDRKGAEAIVGRVETNKNLGSMAKDHELSYAGTHMVRNKNFWDETTESLKERAGTRNWHDRADTKTQMLTYYCNLKILEECEAKEDDGLAMTLGDVKTVSKNVRSMFETLEGKGFKAAFRSASISPGRANKMLNKSENNNQGSLF